MLIVATLQQLPQSWTLEKRMTWAAPQQQQQPDLVRSSHAMMACSPGLPQASQCQLAKLKQSGGRSRSRQDSIAPLEAPGAHRGAAMGRPWWRWMQMQQQPIRSCTHL